MIETTIYTKANCTQCDATKAHLDNLGVAYNTVSIEDNPDVLEKLMALGFRGAPVVITSKGAWAGYKKEKIEEVFGL